MSFYFSWLIPFVIKLLFSLWFVFFLILIAKFVASRVKKNVSSNDIEMSTYNQRLAELLSDVTYRAIITFAVMIFFEMMGINIWFLIAWLTFGIGFAIKEILGNMFAWLMILTNKKFTIGDIVQFEWDIDYFGKILEITIRHTLIQTFDHRRVIVPNIILVQNFVKTFSSEDIIKVDCAIDLGFEDKPSEVCQTIKEYINSKDFTLQQDSTKVMVDHVGESGYHISIFFYMKPKGKQWLLVAKSLIYKELLTLYTTQWRHYPRDHIVIE